VRSPTTPLPSTLAQPRARVAVLGDVKAESEPLRRRWVRASICVGPATERRPDGAARQAEGAASVYGAALARYVRRTGPKNARPALSTRRRSCSQHARVGSFSSRRWLPSGSSTPAWSTPIRSLSRLAARQATCLREPARFPVPYLPAIEFFPARTPCWTCSKQPRTISPQRRRRRFAGIRRGSYPTSTSHQELSRPVGQSHRSLDWSVYSLWHDGTPCQSISEVPKNCPHWAQLPCATSPITAGA